MIEKFEDLKLDDLKLDETLDEKLDLILKEKLDLTISVLQNSLSNWLQNNAEKLALTLPNIAPKGDYEHLLEDNDSMSEFLKNEAHKPEYWKVVCIRADKNPKLNLIIFDFDNTAVDDGGMLKGLVFVSMQGKIKHTFAQGDL